MKWYNPLSWNWNVRKGVTAGLLATALAVGSYYSCGRKAEPPKSTPAVRQAAAPAVPKAPEKTYVDKKVKVNKGDVLWKIVEKEYGFDLNDYETRAEYNKAVADAVNEVADFNKEKQEKHPHYGVDNKAVVDGAVVNQSDKIRGDLIFYGKHKNSDEGDEITLPGLKVEVESAAKPSSASQPSNPAQNTAGKTAYVAPIAATAYAGMAEKARYAQSGEYRAQESKRANASTAKTVNYREVYEKASALAMELLQNPIVKGSAEDIFKMALEMQKESYKC